jgi:hypothetical protein
MPKHTFKTPFTICIVSLTCKCLVHVKFLHKIAVVVDDKLRQIRDKGMAPADSTVWLWGLSETLW